MNAVSVTLSVQSVNPSDFHKVYFLYKELIYDLLQANGVPYQPGSMDHNLGDDVDVIMKNFGPNPRWGWIRSSKEWDRENVIAGKLNEAFALQLVNNHSSGCDLVHVEPATKKEFFVEIKVYNTDVEMKGLAQCFAYMLRNGNVLPRFGLVTNGNMWRFVEMNRGSTVVSPVLDIRKQDQERHINGWMMHIQEQLKVVNVDGGAAMDV